MTPTFYGPAVAYTHDRAFTEGQKTLGPELLKLMRSQGLTSGLLVDLGCGSGQWLQQASGAGYDVLGIDQSEALLGFARDRLPSAELRLGSIYESELPTCAVVTALGEVLNYVPDEKTVQPLRQLFARVHKALMPAGMFVFDLIDPFPNGLSPERNWHEREGFAIMFEKSVEGAVLKREIVCFLREQDTYSRTHETHFQRLFSAQDVHAMLEHAGFSAETTTRLGMHEMLPNRRMYLATKS